jgi:hypothetical protein
MACAAESVSFKLLPVVGAEFSWKIRSMLEKSNLRSSNITRMESRALISSKQDREIKILPADKGNCTVVLNDSTYKQKIFSLLESGVYETLKKDPTSQIERKIRRLLFKHKSILSTDLKRKLTSYHSKHPHLYGLPKIHKPDIPLRPIVSSIGSPCYVVAGLLHKILVPLIGNTDSFVKNSEHLIQLLEDINLRNWDILVSFDVLSLFTNVPVAEILQVIKNKLCMDPTVSDPSPLQVDDVMELLEVCMKTTYFQLEDKFYQQKMVWLWAVHYLRLSVIYSWNILRN